MKELKKVSYVAAPMVAVTVLQYLMQVVSVMMVGHLDELSLSGISSASSFTIVTGFSLLVTTYFPFLIGNCTQVPVSNLLQIFSVSKKLFPCRMVDFNSTDFLFELWSA